MKSAKSKGTVPGNLPPKDQLEKVPGGLACGSKMRSAWRCQGWDEGDQKGLWNIGDQEAWRSMYFVPSWILRTKATTKRERWKRCSGHASATTWNRQSPKGQYQLKAPKKSRNLKCLDLKWRGRHFFGQIGKGADNITSPIGSNHFLYQKRQKFKSQCKQSKNRERFASHVPDEFRSNKAKVYPSARWVNWRVELHIFVGLLSIYT